MGVSKPLINSAQGQSTQAQIVAALIRLNKTAAIAIPLAFYLGKTGVDRALLVGCIILILIVEILNSAVEAVVDKASPEKHDLAKRAKDMGSAAVLLSLLNAAVVWACILWP